MQHVCNFYIYWPVLQKRWLSVSASSSSAQQQQLEALIEVWVVIILEERSMAAAAAPPFFSGFDMALLLGVLASILASNSLHLSYLFVSGNPDYNKLVRRC